MTLPSKTRLGKRKLEINGIAPKTSSKSKAELLDELEEMHLLKELNEALLEEVKTNEETITNLKKKEKKSVEAIKNLEQKIEKQQSSKVGVLCMTFGTHARSLTHARLDSLGLTWEFFF